MNAHNDIERFLHMFADALGVDRFEFMQGFANHVNMEVARQQQSMEPIEGEDANVFLDVLLQQMYPNVRSFNQ
jgi:hypothetical protein